MRHEKCNLLQVITVALTVAVMDVASASESLKSYHTDFSRNKIVPIYKFIDSNGRVTYSSVAQSDFVESKKVVIESPPPAEYVNEARLRSEKLKAAADELGKAREKREKIRQEKENKRLERLALINQSRPQSYNRYGYQGYPYLFWGGGIHHGGQQPHYPMHLPTTHQNSSPSLSVTSGFLPALH